MVKWDKILYNKDIMEKEASYLLKKRMLCLLLTVVLGMTLCAAAEEATEKTYVMAGYDATQYRDWDTNLFFQRMEEKTGVHFGYRQYTDASEWARAKANMKAGGELSDVLFKAALTASECMEMLDSGTLIDLKPYLQENCPNLWALLSENPEYLAAITLPDGRIAALPYITTLPLENYIWINKAWLDTLHLDMPTTADELVKVLTAFRDRDPNRNGRKDEIPLGFMGPFDLKFLAHAFGLIANDYNVFAQDGQARFMPLEENYRLFVTWCRDLYQAGLLDKNGFTISSMMRQVTDSKATPTYGAILAPVAADVFRVDWASDYVILQPLTYDGKQIYRQFSGPVLRGTFAVTSACDDPAAMLRWVDTLYSQEGAVLSSIGQENTDYVVDGDGTWRLTEAASSDSLFKAATLIDGGATAPGMLADAFQRRYSGSKELLSTLESQDAVKRVAVRPFPYYSLTQAQKDEITPLQNAIGEYVDMQLARWVLGEEEISDESFASFKRTLDELGLPAFLSFWQDVLNNL